MKKVYHAKISYGLLIFVFIIVFGPLVFPIMENGFDVAILISILFVALIFAFVLHIFLKTEYTLENNELKIKSGVFTFKPIKID